MNNTESDTQEQSSFNIETDSPENPDIALSENDSEVKSVNMKECLESNTSWEEPVQTFRDGHFELLTATLDSNDLRKLGIPRGVSYVDVQIVGGVLLIMPA